MVDRPSRTSMDKDSDTETLVDFEQSAPNGGPAQTDVSDKENIQQTTATDPKLGQLRLKDGNSVFSIAELSSDGSVVKFEDDTQVSGAALSTPPLTPSDEKRPPVPPRNKPAPISTAGPTEDSLRKERLSFGAQQDVTEVIGNVMFRLQCAIKATSYDAQFGEQIDRIRDTFYGANAVYTKKATGYDSKIEDWANVIVFPSSDGTRSIYEALDVVFDEQVVEIESAMTLQHASISKLPPVLQIQIQRTAFNAATKSASKNENRIVFDETIYLDRYMDSDKVLLRRRDAWKWKNRLKQLEARQKVLEMTTPQLTVPEALGMTKKFLQMLQEDEVPDIQVNGDLPEALEERANELVQELASIAEETENLKKKLQDQFTDMRHHRYRLQAVFIHSGNSSFGHYYIFIYDFARDIWREYNDARVSEVHDTKRIFEHSGFNNPTPYYLVYVRDEDKEGLVDAVCREIPETPLASQTERMDSWPQSSGGLDMERDMENQKYHVENADPSLRGLNGNGGGAWGSTSAQQYNTSGGGAWEQDRDRPPFRGG
jgi:ubiquitin carboxyl-terminal hydrolase 25/28